MSSPSFHSKLPDLKPSIFTVMSGLAREHKAINLSQGFPDFSPDPKLISLVNNAMEEGYNQYAPMAGIFSLRKAIAEKVYACYGKNYDPDTEITITAGATQAIFTAITAFVKSGDEVILIKPAYDCYEPAIVANGGIPVAIQMEGPGYSVNWENLKTAMSPRTKMVIINSPHNPSGRIFSESDLMALQQILKDTAVIVLSDEVYEHLVFDGEIHQSVARYPLLSERSLICVSFGKTFHTTGWKMGYCLAPEPLMAEFQKIHEFNVYSTNHPVQKALATYMQDAENYQHLSAFFQKKRDLFLDAISGSRFTFSPAQGTYFQLLNYGNISSEGDIDFARELTVKHGLASIPVSVFNKGRIDHNHLRFCFAKKEETLLQAAAILNRL